MTHLMLYRIADTGKQTLGFLWVFKDHKMVYGCRSLELPDKGNKKNISRIPDRLYKLKKRYTAKFGEHLHVLNVPNRTWILIHAANFYHELKGCIAVGKKWKDIDGDREFDMVDSRQTLAKIMSYINEDATLEIMS